MDTMGVAMEGMNKATNGFMMQYSVGVTKRAMTDQIRSAKNMLDDMMPQQQQQQARRPQPGDHPAIPKGQYVDVYA